MRRPLATLALTHTHTHTHTHTQTHMHAHTHTCTRMHTHAHAHTHTCTHTHTHTHACTHTRTHAGDVEVLMRNGQRGRGGFRGNKRESWTVFKVCIRSVLLSWIFLKVMLVSKGTNYVLPLDSY